MTIIGIDDTDSRSEGMCTTFIGSQIVSEIETTGATVNRVLLIRLNPAVKHKTRGNAAVAIHTDLDADKALQISKEIVVEHSAVSDERTNPGIVVFDGKPSEISSQVANFATMAITEILSIERVKNLIKEEDLLSFSLGKGRGRIGSVAAIGAWDAFDDFTLEYISYRERERWGTERDVDEDSLFTQSDKYYPKIWDTVDKGEAEAVAVPHTPCPILHGIRGDSETAVKQAAEQIKSEPVHSRQLFITNQGTDMHLTMSTISEISNNKAYRVTGTVSQEPYTKKGGHVFFTLRDGQDEIDCAAFEPTKRFRNIVRKLTTGDTITVCGEVSENTVKLEKFAVRELRLTEQVNPECPDCNRTMKSAGRNQGYRCKQCSNTTPEKETVQLERMIGHGWYEVPPCARRHIAKPLIRGGFDDTTHPER